MRIGVLADVHSNLEALEAVLEDMGRVDQIWCLGDVVGYGPEPNACCEVLSQGNLQSQRTQKVICVAGNHDWGVLGKLDLAWFNNFAREAITITQKIIKKEPRTFLESLPEIQKLDKVVLVHGSVREPLTKYIFERHQAAINFENFSEKICFVGHTHYPVIFEMDEEIVREIVPHFQKKVKLRKGCRYIINPGSVGQPRDGDWRASYGLFDDHNLSFEFRRVEYPIEKNQKKMRKLGLPEFLVQRLSLGR